MPRTTKPKYGSRLIAICCLAVATNTFAAPPTTSVPHQFRIESQDLRSALDAFSEQSQLQLFYSTELVEHLKTSGVNGTLNAWDALKMLLKDSGLQYRVIDDKTITLERPTQGSLTTETLLAAAGELVLADAELEEEPYTGPVEQEDLTVSGGNWSGYKVLNANTATKTNTPIMETPVSIQVVPRSVMDDQKSTRIKDALENVSGVRARSTANLGTGFIVRGFQTEKIYRNGLIASAANDAFPSEFDTTNIESIEVLKGPAAVLYGRSEPGGLVNINTKKPQAQPYYSVEQQVGSYDHYRTQWDATSAITDNETLLYRFTGSYQNNDSFRDFVSSERFVLAPSVTWQPIDALDFTVNLEWLDQDFQADFGIPVIGDRPAAIPINRSMGDSNDPLDNQRTVHLGAETNFRFNENWALHNRFLASFNHSDLLFLTPAPAHGIALEADNRTFGRSVFHEISDEETYTTNLDLTGKFEVVGTKHDVLIGFDYLRSHTQYQIHGAYYAPTPGLELDILNPSYGIDSSTFDIPHVSEGWNFPTYLAEWYGVYFQDHITLWDKLHISGGGRYDWARTGNEWNASFAASDANMKMNHDEGFSPRVGIVYQPIEELSLYGNWTTSFGANNGKSATGSRFDPEIGEQYEAGIKSELFDHRLTTTLAYYYLTKENMLMPDLTTADPDDNTTIGKARSQGIELDVSGQITDQFSLIGTYAYTDARQIKDTNGNQGNRLVNVPEHSGSLWARYDFNGFESLNGFSLGLGGVAAGKREGDLENTFQLPGFVRLDAFAAYKLKVGDTKVTAQINVRNVLDKEYFESTDLGSNAAPRNSVYLGAPLTAIGSLRVEF